MIKHICIRRNLGINKQAKLLETLTALRSFNSFIYVWRSDHEEQTYRYYQQDITSWNKHSLGPGIERLMPPRLLFSSLAKKSRLVEVGVIFGISYDYLVGF